MVIDLEGEGRGGERGELGGGELGWSIFVREEGEGGVWEGFGRGCWDGKMEVILWSE